MGSGIESRERRSYGQPALNNLERRSSSLQLAWGITAAAGLIAVLAMVSLLRPEPAVGPSRVLRATLAPPMAPGFGSDRYSSESNVAVSLDGRSIAFVATHQLWIRPLSEATPKQIPGTEGANFPFWSPDSETLGFFAGGKLKRVAAIGGPVTTICAAPHGRGGSWGPDGKILFAPDSRTGIFEVDAGGGEPRAVTTVDSPVHSTHRWPAVLPGGGHFLFLAASHANPRGGQNGIYIAPISGGQPRLLTVSDAKPVLSAGRLLFLREGSLLAQPFDLARLALVGEAIPLAAGVRYRGGSWSGVFSASRRDVLAFEIGSRNLGTRPTWIDRLGNEEGVLGESGLHWDLRVSPQGDRVAVATGSPKPELWIYELDRQDSARLTLETSFNRAPVWSPDGERLAFAAMNENGRLNMFVVSSRGAGDAELLRESKLDQVPTSWSPDGRWLAFDQGPPGATEIWIMSLDGAGEPFPFVQTRPWAGDGQFSPDGRWLLYTSRESSADQVYVSPFPSAGDRWQVSASGRASQGRWGQVGDKVFFGTSQAVLMEVEIRRRKKDGGLDLGMPKMLFSYREDDSVFRGHNGFYDVVGDGERFLLAQGPERGEDQGLIMLVVPWFAEIEEENQGPQSPGAG